MKITEVVKNIEHQYHNIAIAYKRLRGNEWLFAVYQRKNGRSDPSSVRTLFFKVQSGNRHLPIYPK